VAGAASVAGAITGPVALLAFGLDSVIDGSASGVPVWRFRLEVRGAGGAALLARDRVVEIAVPDRVDERHGSPARGRRHRVGPGAGTNAPAYGTLGLLETRLLPENRRCI